MRAARTSLLVALALSLPIGLGGLAPTAGAGDPPTYADAIRADNPVAYWRLGEQTGTVAADASGNGNDAEYRDNVEQGRQGAVGDGNGAVAVLGDDGDGLDDGVRAADRDSLDFGTDDFSVEFWIKTTVHQERVAVAKYDGTDPNWRITVTDDVGYEGAIRAKLSDPSTETAYSAIPVVDGAWHHVVVVFDRDFAVMVFVDGIGNWGPIGSHGNVSNAAPLQIGSTAGYPSLNGEIDDVAVYGRSLPASRILAHHRAGLGQHDPLSHYASAVAADRPVGHWRLGEDARATVAVDQTGNGIDGRYKDTFPGNEGALAGDADTSARFTGEIDVSGDDVFVGDRAQLDFGQGDFSVEAWVKTTRHDERPIVAKANDWSQAQWQLTVTNDDGFVGRPRMMVWDGVTGYDAYGPARVDDGAWHHVVAVVDRDTGVHVYVDGVARSLRVPLTTDVSNSHDFRIGDLDLREPFDGTIDEVAVYDSAVSASRAIAHYRAGRALFSAASRYRDEVLLDQPSAYWRLGDGDSDVAADASGNRLDGRYQDGARGGVDGALAGDADTAATFPHPDPGLDAAEVELDDRDLLDPGLSDFTVEAWVKTGVVWEREDRGIIAKEVTEDPSQPSWEVTVTNDGGFLGRARLKVFDGTATRKAYGPAVRLDDGGWHHVAFVVDRDWGVHAYVDGAVQSTWMPTPGAIQNAGDTDIGDTDDDDGLQGELDEVAFYRHALSAERLGAHRSWADRYSLDVTLGPLTATSLDDATTVAPTDWGAHVTTEAPSWRHPESYRWRFQLGPNQRLQRLSTGGVAVVTDASDEDVGDAEDDYSDADPVEPEDVDEGIETDESAPEDDVDDEETSEEDEEYDDEGPFEPDSYGDAPGERALGILDEAQDEVEDGIVEAVAAPEASDAAGHAVPVAFTVQGNVATLTISHRNARYDYPVRAAVDLVEALGASTYTEDDVAASMSMGPSATRMQTMETAAEEAVTCDPRRRAKIITYNPVGRAQLIAAFKRYPTPCADYFIVISPPPGPAKPEPMPAEWTKPWIDWKRKQSIKKRQVRENQAQDVCAVNNDPAVRNAKARFYPVAEFHWGGWGWWVWHEQESRRDRSIAARWRRAGINFREAMQGQHQGYGRDCPGTPENDPIPEYWAINEFPSTLTVRKFDRHFRRWFEPAEVRLNTKQAMAGLYTGPDGFGPRDENNSRRSRACERPIYVAQEQKRYVDCPGTPFVIDAGHTAKKLVRYKSGMRALILDASYWNAVRTYVKFWSQETYVNCWKVCLSREFGGTQRYNRATRASFANAFGLHPIKFAHAGARAGSAKAKRALGALNSRYAPLLTAYWKGAAYGHTDGDDFTKDRMKGHVSLQVYATRRHAALADGSSSHAKYPHLRIAFAWHELGVTNPLYDENQDVAYRLAQAIQAAYRTDQGNAGTAAAACAGGPSSVGGDWCRVNVPQTACGPHVVKGVRTDDHRTVFIRAWEKTFTTWSTKVFNRTVYCQ